MLLTDVRGSRRDDVLLNEYDGSAGWLDVSDQLVPCRAEYVRVYSFEGEAVLFDARTGHSHHLNETAFAVWQSCDGSSTVAHIAQRLTERFDVDLETALDHVEQVLAVLADAELVGAHDP